MKIKTHGFLISLDEIFDTRLAVLESMDEAQANDLLIRGYYTRDRDEFEGFDVYEFRKRYAERGLAVLKNSQPTSLLVHLHEIIGLYIIDNTLEAKSAQVEVILNIYPYKLNGEEINETVLCLKYLLGNITPVRVINAPLEQITPSWLDDNVTAFYCYEWSKWIGIHLKSLIKHRLKGFQLCAAKIKELTQAEAKKQLYEFEQEHKDLILDRDEVKELKEADFFDVVGSILNTNVVGFDFTEIREFCIYLPDDVEPKKEI